MPEAKAADWSATLNLPKTSFPMKGDLPKREPEVLARWAGLYAALQKMQETRRSTFVLHDGPPYANGLIHIGHALNKILKDVTAKSRSLLGVRTPYVPGWDCHGLPIETALLKELKISQRGIKDIPAFRAQAEAFAERFIASQREEFKRLGVIGDWDHPYKTMSRDFEAKVIKVFRLLLKQGSIYRGLKPVYWCISCETALADAEIEYKDKQSPSVYVALPLEQPPAELKGASLLVWTTTPWTLPANMAVAVHPGLEYVLIDASTAGGKSHRLLVARNRQTDVIGKISAEPSKKVLRSWKGRELAAMGLRYRTPYGDRKGPVLTADYVTAEDGTGLVHTAPGHGADDFHTGQKNGLTTLNPVDSSGRFMPEAGTMAGKHIFKEGNPAIVADLAARGWLLGEEKIQHSYPHCWRCKNPVIFRATEQWFLSVSKDGLREKLLAAVAKVKWIPAAGQARISAMVAGRPDWCLSRQRVWGTPIPILYCAACRKPVTDDAVLKAIEDEVAKSGDAFWFSDWEKSVTRAAWPFLPEKTLCPCGSAEFRRETDILDVWMDSGASWLAVLEDKGQAPCDLYLEGSDQHRGWFQSSLVLGTAIKGAAPYKAVLTHGFVLDEQGRAMHKSAGNVVAPQQVIAKIGADVLRLWVALSDWSDDVRISDKLLEVPADAYRRFRNTVRYLLGNTSDFAPSDKAPFAALPELERYVLHRLTALQKGMLKDYEAFEYRAAARRLTDFCSFDLSSFYLDILKDRLYTFAANDPARRAAQTVMVECLERLLMLAAPILSFTAEEAWGFWRQEGGSRRKEESVFLAELPKADASWEDASLAERWAGILKVREIVQKALEESRAAKKIGSSLQAKVSLSGGDGLLEGAAAWEEILLVSQAEVRAGPGELKVQVLPAEGAKCPRCWRWQTDIGSSSRHPELCGRCSRHVPA